MRLTLAPVALALALAACSSGKREPSGVPEIPPADPMVPARFAEGVVTTPDYDFFTTFTPDGQIMLFCLATPSFSHFTILATRLVGGRWTPPEVVAFSGRYSDADPRFSPDGERLFFVSNRPLPGDPVLKPDLDIWVVERTAAGWGVPRHLGPNVNSPSNEFSPSVTSDGTLYFGSTRNPARRLDIYRSRFVNGDYRLPENLGDSINTEFSEIDPYVAPDGGYMIFGAAGRPDGLGGIDLYISQSRDGVWLAAKPLPPGINSPATDFSPTVSPDGRYLYFTSTRGSFDQPPRTPLAHADLVGRLRGLGNGLGDVYRVDMQAVWAGLAPGSAPSPDAGAASPGAEPAHPRSR